MSQGNAGSNNRVDRTRVPRRIHARQVANRVARTYKKADAQVVKAAKKAVPQKTLHQLSANRAKNNGDLRLKVSISRKRNKQFSFVIPRAVGNLRHAALPIAIISLVSVFALAGASPPSYSWTRSIGGAGIDRADSVVVDTEGNTYTVGAFQGTVDFGADWGSSDTKTSSNSGVHNDIFLTKINANGSYGWTKAIPGAASTASGAYRVATDSTNNLYLTGTFTDTVNFANDWSTTDEKTSNGNTDIFLTKINANGSYGWTKAIGGAEEDKVGDVTVDSSGVVYVAGSFQGAVTFDTDFGSSDDLKTSDTSSEDVFVTKIDAAGDYVETAQLGGSGTESTARLATDSTNNLYLTGTFTDTVNFANDWSTTDEKTSNGNTDIFLTKINANGSYGWTKAIGGAEEDKPSALQADATDTLYLGGTIASATVDFGVDWGETDVKNRTGNLDSFITKIDDTNTYLWTKIIGGATSTVSIKDISVDSDNNLFIGGAIDGTVDFGADWGASAVKTTTDNGFVVKVLSDNAFGWAATADVSGGASEVTALAVDADDTMYAAGTFNGSVDFGADYDTSDTKTSNSTSQDVFITKVMRGSDSHTIGDAAGLTFKDENGVNLSSAGTTETNPTVYIHNQSDEALIATIVVDLTENRDWASVSGESDTTSLKSVINDAIGAPGAASTMTLYVPKGDGDTAVALCPNIETLLEVTSSCAGKQMFTQNSDNVTTATVEGIEYWVIEGLTDQKIGGMSVDRPKVQLHETDDSTEVTEGGATDFVLLQLDARPSNDVTVQVVSSPEGQLAVIEEVVFTSTNWNDPVLVEVVAVDDNVIEGNHVGTLGYTATSEDSVYDGMSESDLVSVGITDNDSAGVQLTAASNLVNENGDTTEVCAVLTAQPAHSVELQFTSSNTSEVTVSSPLTVGASQWNSEDNCVTVTGVDDNVVDGPQNATIRVSGIASDDEDFASLDANDIDTIQITNQDNDTAAFIVSAEDTTTTEAGGEVEVCIKLTARPLANVIIPVAVSDETEGTLQSVTSLTITPSAWNSEDNCVTVTGVDDNVVDGDIQYDLITGDPTSADEVWNALGANEIADQTLTNSDDDEAGVIISGGAGLAVTEGATTDTFSVALASEPINDSEVVVKVLLSNELNAGGGAGTTATLTFTSENWNQPQMVTVEAVDDNKVEGDHSGSIVITVDESTNEPSYIGLVSQNLSVSITDNDTAIASVSAVNDASEQPESNGRFRVSLDKANNTGEDMTFAYSVEGTAVGDQHYTALTGTAVVADGESSVDIIVSTAGRDNALLEGNKSVTITLDTVDSPLAQIGDPATATVIIFDDERAEASLAVTQNGNEAGEVDVMYTVTLDIPNNTGEDITLRINDDGGTAAAGEDYETFDGNIVAIPNGATTGTAIIPVVDDELFENETETIVSIIDNPSHAGVIVSASAASGEATITDNDTAEISFEALTATANEHPSSNGAIRIMLNKVNHTNNALQVAYEVSGTATANSDYAQLSGTATIASGQQYTDVVIDTGSYNDDDMEGAETVVLTYASNTIASRVSVGENDNAQVTIVDDETAGVTITATDDTTSEDGDTGQICAALASRPAHSVTILLESEDSAKVSVPSSMTIQRDDWSNASSNCVTVTGHDDAPATVTGTQNITIRTTDVQSDDPFYNALEDNDVQDIVIQHTDNDTPGVTVTSVSTTTSEDGTKSAAVRFRLQTQPTDDVLIPLTISDETEGATNDDVIVITPENWNIPANNEVIVSGVDDYLTDGDIDYLLETGDPVSDDVVYDNLIASDVANVQLTNEDDDEAGVSIDSGGDVVVSEGAAGEAVDVRLASQPAAGNTVTVRAVPADIQLDLGLGAGVPIELEFDPQNWQSGQQFTVTAFDDDLLENNHSSQVSYEIVSDKTSEAAYSDYEITTTTTVTISDNDTAVATFTLSDGHETGPIAMSAEVVLDKVNNTGETITLSLNPVGGTATADSDYADFADTVISIPDGESSAEVQIAVIDDDLLEGEESVEALVSSVSTASVNVANANQSAVIADNDTATVTIVATTPTAYENPAHAGAFTVYLSRVNNTGAPIEVAYEVSGEATAGEDYEALPAVVSIPVGASSAIIPVTTTGFNDEVVEGSETVTVTLQDTNHDSVTVSGPLSAIVTIVDDDSFMFSLQKIQDGTEGESDVVYRVQLSQVNTTGSPVTVDIADTAAGTATAGDDYQNFGGTISIPDGQQHADYTVTVVDDDDLEDIYETVEARISNPSEGEIGVADATAAIVDTDTGVLTIEAAQDAAENPSSNGQAIITLDKINNGSLPIAMTYTVNGTATAGEDYAPLSGHAMIAAGQDSTVINIDVSGYDDDLYEGEETVVITLSSVDHPNVTIGDQLSAAITITDNDSAPAPPDNNENPDESSNDHTGAPVAQAPRSQNTVYIPVKKEIIERGSEDSGQGQIVDTPQPQPIQQKEKDNDNDGIADDEEDKAHNNGDGNGDGIPDSKQSNVASLISAVTKSPVTLEARGECSDITKFAIVAEDSLAKQDKRYSYPYGLVDFKIACPESGDKSTVAVYFDRTVSSTSKWRKFNGIQNKFDAMEFVDNIQKPVGTSRVTAVQYILQDGGSADSDGKANGEIVDPAGFASRTFYVLDLGWLIPVVVAGGFIGYAAWHRVRDYRRYR